MSKNDTETLALRFRKLIRVITEAHCGPQTPPGENTPEAEKESARESPAPAPKAN